MKMDLKKIFDKISKQNSLLELDLKNKTVVITGGSKGLGKSLAQFFKEENSKVIICSKNDSEIKQEANALGVTYFTGDVTKEEVEAIKALLHHPIDKAQADLKNGLFENYTEFTTLTGYTIHNVKEAITFNNFHEAIHTGVMMGIRKFV